LIDRNNYHTFFPLLYQIAASELGPEDIVYPVRSIVRRFPSVKFIMGKVKGIDIKGRVVIGDDFTAGYDYLIIASGSVSSFFNVKGAAQNSFPLKTLDDAVYLRNHILSCFEHAVHEREKEKRKKLLTFCIIGGGPTGVEFAGALAELIRGPLAKDFPSIDMSEVKIILIEAGGLLLPGVPRELSEYTLNRLRSMGVDVRLNSVVTEIGVDYLLTKDGKRIDTETAVWTAGVRGSNLAEDSGLKTIKNGRVPVLPTLQVIEDQRIYVIGDLAYLEQDGKALPMIAPVAIQQGLWAGKNIIRQIYGYNTLPFRYKDKGTMVTIGRNKAVAHLRGFSFTGFPAWVVWLSVHLFNLIGFRNRLIVLINWAWDYIFFERAIRLIHPGRMNDKL
ncbi:MAG: NAD(P)/FAD-dependent oxidoreductase, partial [Candidatus Aenigmatarchaeota archaeon]